MGLIKCHINQIVTVFTLLEIVYSQIRLETRLCDLEYYRLLIETKNMIETEKSISHLKSSALLCTMAEEKNT